MTTTEAWTQWEGKVVDSVFLLRRFLGSSGHNGVFLTEHVAENRPEVAIKLVPADTVQAETQLLQWGLATTLSHPNLVRIFDVGRHRHDGREFLYVVTEYADQTLAEILPRRPLAVEEVRELLLPTLDALLFLHRKGLIHGHLKPSNFLAVNDRLKLSSDTVRAVNHAEGGSVRTSAYDPPERKDRGMNAAGDMWALGMTLLEALTQRTTAWPDETVSLPADLPAPFANAILRCLSTPAARPTVLDLETQFKLGAPAQSAPPPSTREASPPPPPKSPPRPRSQKQSSWARPFSIAFTSSLAAWAAFHFLTRSPAPTPEPAAATTAPVPAPAPVEPAIVEKPVEPQPPAATQPTPTAPSSGDTLEGVVQKVMPDVPKATLDTIRGRMHVTVRVLVDPEGNVMGAMVESPGPSKHLAALAEQAAGDWKFAPSAKQKSRVWLLRFVFTRNGANVRAVAQ